MSFHGNLNITKPYRVCLVVILHNQRGLLYAAPLAFEQGKLLQSLSMYHPGIEPGRACNIRALSLTADQPIGVGCCPHAIAAQQNPVTPSDPRSAPLE
jgi:hypothetical protein